MNRTPHRSRIPLTWAVGQRRRTSRGSKSVSVEVLESRQMLSAVTVQVPASQDTTLYNDQPEDANGAGQFLLTGTAGDGDPGKHALVEFDLESLNIPSGATIVDAVLTLNLAESLGPSVAVSVHLVTTAWGEAGSDAPGSEILGAAAQQFDATWIYAFFDGALWNSPGGDYVGAPSATTDVDQPGIYQWTDSGLIADVQQWLDDPESNHGWAVIGPGKDNLKSFTSKDGDNAALHPILEITYEEAQLPGIVHGRIWHDLNADGTRVPSALADLGLKFSGGRTFFNLYGGGEYWMQSADTHQWYFFRENGHLTKWSGQPRSLSGETVAQLDPRVYYSIRLLIRPGDAEPWINGFTVELLDSSGAVIATDLTHSIDIDGNGIIDPENEDGWYRFENLADGEYRVRHVPPEGWKITGEWNGPVGDLVVELQQSLGLRFSNSLYENVGGLGERWVRGNTGWYYLTPNGSLYEWDRQRFTTSVPLSGTLVAGLGVEYYRNPSLLFDPNSATVQVSAVEEHVLLRVDWGDYQPVDVRGRKWFEFHPDGERDPGTPSGGGLIATISGPYDLSGSGGSWFYNEGADEWYIVTADGVVELWDGTPPSPDGPGGTNDPGSTVFDNTASVDAEPWLNGWTVELLDENGYVVSSTVTGDVDANQDGVTDIETERGWYSFAGLAPGNYTVNFVEPAGWLQTNLAAANDAATIAQMAQQQPFELLNTDFYNWGGRHERWIRNGSAWYFIVPQGMLYRYQTGTGGAGGGLQGTEVARLSSSFFLNLNLFVHPASTTISTRSGSSSQRLDSGTHRLLDGVFADLADLLG
ncbi:MAG: SdrD B-like domain-containing protein [Planctomycetaceae bacterium]